jgi:hypothetical protein
LQGVCWYWSLQRQVCPQPCLYSKLRQVDLDCLRDWLTSN